MTKKSGTINLLKFVFSIFIILLHCGMIFQFPYFQGAWIFVEWFFIFAGYSVAKNVDRDKQIPSVGNKTVSILKKRIFSILPYYLVSILIALIVRLVSGEFQIHSLNDTATVFSELFMLQMFGFNNASLVGTSWFLSAMWIALALLVPCIICFRKTFTKVFSLLISLLIYGYLAATTGYLWGPGIWLTFCFKGVLRALAGLCLGFFSYELGQSLKSRLNHPVLESLFTYGSYLLILLFTVKYEDSLWYFFIPFAFTLLIAITMNKKSGLDIQDNAFTQFLGKISMILFLNHVYWIYAIQYLYPEWPNRLKVPVTFGCVAVSSLLIYFLILLYQKLKKRILAKKSL